MREVDIEKIGTQDGLIERLRRVPRTGPLSDQRLDMLCAADAITALRAEVERLTRERDDAEVRAGEMRMCVNCGKVRHAGEPRDDLPECTDPATGFAACTWDATPQEAWHYWRDEAHRKHERATAAEADAAAARKQVRKLREALRQIAERDEGSDPRFTDRMIARAALQGEG